MAVELGSVEWGDAAAWGSSLIALLALAVSGFIARAQYRLGVDQRNLAVKQYQLGVAQRELSERTASENQALAVAHQGAQTAMMWRDQVLALHDRGLNPEEIRWIMCCEDEGVGHEQWNGIIDEIVGNVPRVPPENMIEASTRSDHRRLPRPRGQMRADFHQDYGFGTEHLDKNSRG